MSRVLDRIGGVVRVAYSSYNERLTELDFERERELQNTLVNSKIMSERPLQACHNES